VKDSGEFRRFEDDLISDARWQNKEAVLREIEAPILLAPIEETLAAFREALEAKFKLVNERIASGENKYIKLKAAGEKRCWSLIYPIEEEPINSSFYSQLPGIGIANLLWFVATKTGFLRLETVHAGNDAICNATAALPASHHYDIHEELHSSSDGPRFETQINTINARYSRKYFTLKKGVSAYTLVLNHAPINARVIGTHEHESHYVYDLLHNNTTHIKPERHSTDTHGSNQVNFWILHVFGYRFAPRYRDLYKRMDTLVGFMHPNHYKDFLIKPVRKVFDSLICMEWPNVQRIVASLAQKDVTQATIVRKLASYRRQNQTKKALWELDNICRTLYILDFIDDEALRQRDAESPQPRRSLSPFPPGDCLRQFGQVPQDGGRTATLERVFAADRQRGHLLQHSIVVAGLRTKAMRRRPSGNGLHQRRLACRLAARQFVRNYRI
jgi:TnpA family transposase